MERELKNKIAEKGFAYYITEINLSSAINTSKIESELEKKSKIAYDEFIHACQDYEDYLNGN